MQIHRKRLILKYDEASTTGQNAVRAPRNYFATMRGSRTVLATAWIG
jgi:hypothetical protein